MTGLDASGGSVPIRDRHAVGLPQEARMGAHPDALAYTPAPMIIDGKSIAAKVKAEVAEAVRALAARGVRPGLTVVRVGEDPASAIYVRGKRKDCEEVGITSVEHHLPATVAQDELLALVARSNADPSVHGILVQLPLPKHLSERAILDAISPAKDAAGFHPFNVG